MDGPGTHFYVEDTNPFRNRAGRRQRSSTSPAASFDRSYSESRAGRMVDQHKKKASCCPQEHHHHHHHRMSRVYPDIIDQLDNVGSVQYHHEGPYDAVYPERNRCSLGSPIEALKESNEETLRATPMYKIVDSIRHHRPLDGVAYYPPGTTDPEGHTYQYTEGDNMMAEIEGNFVRAPGMVSEKKNLSYGPALPDQWLTFPLQKFTDEDFKNDPFYQDQQRPPRRMGSLRKALGFKGRSRKNTA